MLSMVRTASFSKATFVSLTRVVTSSVIYAVTQPVEIVNNRSLAHGLIEFFIIVSPHQSIEQKTLSVACTRRNVRIVTERSLCLQLAELGVSWCKFSSWLTRCFWADSRQRLCGIRDLVAASAGKRDLLAVSVRPSAETHD